MERRISSAICALIVVFTTLFLSSCAYEHENSEEVDIEVRENTVFVSAEVFQEETSAVKQVEGNRCRLSLCMGDKVVNEAITTYNGDGMSLKGFENPEIFESPIDENRKTVLVAQRVKGQANVFEKQASYTVVKESAPAPAEPTSRESFAADTTMIYKHYYDEASNVDMVRASMQHKLYKITEWSDGRVDSVAIWDKKIKVATTYIGVSEGKAYSRTAAKDFLHTSSLVWYGSSEKVDEAFTIQTREGEFVYKAEYICDANKPLESKHGVVAEESTVKCSYGGYEETYDFRWEAAFVSQTEVNQNLADETRDNYTYKYETNSVSKWTIALNGSPVGVHNVDIAVLRYLE